MSFGTGAGKGSLPRKVDLNTYHNNYDNIFGKGKVAPTTEPKPEDGNNLQEENQHLKDQLATRCSSSDIPDELVLGRISFGDCVLTEYINPHLAELERDAARKSWTEDAERMGGPESRLRCSPLFGAGNLREVGPAPKPEDGNNLQEENQHLKDQLATLATIHAKDVQRLSDMMDFRDNAIRKLRDAKGRHHSMLATRALFDIVSEEHSRDGEN